MRSLAQTHAAADISLHKANETIHGLQSTIQKHEMSQAELHGIVQTMQTAIDNQNLHITIELESVRKKHENEVEQIQARHALQAQEYQQHQRGREEFRGEVSLAGFSPRAKILSTKAGKSFTSVIFISPALASIRSTFRFRCKPGMDYLIQSCVLLTQQRDIQSRNIRRRQI